MGLFEHLNNLPTHPIRGKLVTIPQPPSEMSGHSYLMDHCIEKPYTPRAGSIEKSPTNFIKGATRTPVPPFGNSTKVLIPPQDPHFSPPRSTLKLETPRWHCPAVREPNAMQYRPSITAAGTFFEPGEAMDGTLQMKSGTFHRSSARNGVVSPLSTSSNHSSSPRREVQTPLSTDATTSSGVAAVVVSRRSPRYANTKFVRNDEGVLIMHPIAARKEGRSLETSPCTTPRRGILSSPSLNSSSTFSSRKKCPVSQDFNKFIEEQLYTHAQHEFDRAMLSPRCVVMDLGMHELKLPATR